VHVSAGSDDEADAKTVRIRLDSLASRLRAAGAESVDLQLLEGDAATEILRLDGRIDDSLIVMGTRGRGLVAEALLGSASREVVRRASGSVLLIPDQAQI